MRPPTSVLRSTPNILSFMGSNPINPHNHPRDIIMHKLLINPTAELILSTYRDLLNQAQGKAQARTLGEMALESDLETIASTPAGSIHGNGGAVPNSYKHMAETTDAEIVWHTRQGAKTVGIQIQRTHAKRVAFGRSATWEQDTDARNAWALLYPERAKRLVEVRKARWQRRFDALGAGDPSQAYAEAQGKIAAYQPGFGAILKDRKDVVAVVRNPQTGCREHVKLAPRFADPKSRVFQAARGDARALIKSALLSVERLDLLEELTPEQVLICLQSPRQSMRTAGIRHAHLLQAA